MAVFPVMPLFFFSGIPMGLLVSTTDYSLILFFTAFVSLVYIGYRTVMLAPDFFMNPTLWFAKEQEPEPAPVMEVPVVQEQNYEQTWQEELRDKIQEIISEQKFD